MTAPAGLVAIAALAALAVPHLTGQGALSAAATIAVTARSRAVAPGEVLLVSVTTATPAERVKVTGLGREFPAFRDGPTSWRVLVGLDLDVKTGPHTLAVEAGPKPADRTVWRFVVAPKMFATRTLSVDPAFVNPPAEAQSRIQADAERFRRAYASSAAEPLWQGSFVQPVPSAANSAFGTRSVFNGEVRSPHAGADFASPAGTPVRAPSAGRIVIAADLYFTGKTVAIDHGLGLFSVLAHLQSIDVREGDPVVTGQFVGDVGRTGRVTGAHLHWSVRIGSARVDPMSLLWALGKQ